MSEREGKLINLTIYLLDVVMDQQKSIESLRDRRGVWLGSDDNDKRLQKVRNCLVDLLADITHEKVVEAGITKWKEMAGMR